jgi:hypothetical protein
VTKSEKKARVIVLTKSDKDCVIESDDLVE